MEKLKISKRLLSLFVSLALLCSYLPLSGLVASAAEEGGNPYYDRVSDTNTMDGWKEFFDLSEGHLDTSNAGGVWTDKSVFTDASAFRDAGITMINDDENFLTALSAIAANKEIVGYSYIPTDTVLILDVSGSMSNYATGLVNAANDAIDDLLTLNKNNRVGVVLYSGGSFTGSATYGQSVTRLLDIDRYTTGSDGNYINLSNGEVQVDGDVKIESTKTAPAYAEKAVSGGTYIQSGLWEAMNMYLEKDTEITGENWQKGEHRMPITVLMSDGAPTNGTSYYDDVDNSAYTTTQEKWLATNGVHYDSFRDIPQNLRQNATRVNVTVQQEGSNVGNGDDSNMTAGQGFLTQLTAAYVKNRIENHYKVGTNVDRSLFYTLGFNIDTSYDADMPDRIAYSVMNPDASTITDALWTSYSGLTGNSTLNVAVKGRNGFGTDVSITKSPYATSKSYVDEYFSASGTGLSDAFNDIVDEIILQSRYYPTHLEGGNPDFAGYIEFTDELGNYMEVKDVKGIVIGNKLFDGHMLASNLTNDKLGTPDAPTALGDEYIRSIKTRLGIAETAEAQALVAKAWNAKQLYYDGKNDWSNYIGWYAKADGTYAGHWKEGDTPVNYPSGATFIMRSYGFLGETTGSIKNSDMMYMTVQVRTDIATGKSTVVWKIPASLVPMITYLVTLTGTNIEDATDISLSIDGVQEAAPTPIRLVFESGLRSDINEFNITEKVQNVGNLKDSHTRKFWTNYFDVTAESHDNHITTMSEFTPSEENERFYYTFDSAVLKKVGNSYTFVEKDEFDPEDEEDLNGEYYHRRYVFKDTSPIPIFSYERISATTLALAEWSDNFHTIDGSDQTIGAYYIPKGTVTRELTPHDREKVENKTHSANMIFHPYISVHNETAYVDMNLGNNGYLEVTPAQGLKISKTIDIAETGASNEFEFKITLRNVAGNLLSGTFNSYVTELDKTPNAAPVNLTFNQGVATIDLSVNETFWLEGLPAGTTYEVEEVSDNPDYKVKSVHVNGTAQGTVARGDIAAYYIDDVDFVNTAVGEGNLIVTKQVVDEQGNTVDVSDALDFTAEITLTEEDGTPVSDTFESSIGSIAFTEGKATVTLSDGESIIIRDIPEETEYTVVEKDMPDGFTLNETASSLSGVIDSTANDQALIVNTYKPVGTNGAPVTLVINKEISGNRTQWNNGEAYSFVVEKLDFARAAVDRVIKNVTITKEDADKSESFNLATETYTAAGTYVYRITETVGTIGGITYDTAERRFEVVVADSDMNGTLEITQVNNLVSTTVSGEYTVTANFNNVYAPQGNATITVDIKKQIENHILSGYEFALLDAQGNKLNTAPIVTDAKGDASIPLTFAANRTGTTYTYYLVELEGNNANIDYSREKYKIAVNVIDNLDGTIRAEKSMFKLVANVEIGEEDEIPVTANAATFTNVYVPSTSVTVGLSGQKTITDNRGIAAGEFQFKIEALTSGAPMPSDGTTTNAANGAFMFGDIVYNEDGIYEYKVTEVDTNIGGMSYDDTQYTVTVTVTNLASTGERKLKADVQIKNGETPVNNILFHNEYEPAPENLIFSGTKQLTGKTLQNEEFTFELKAVTQNAPMPSVTTAKNDAAGNIKFAPITFTEAGVYEYDISEKATDDTRYDFDKSVYRATVTVTDDGEGKLSIRTALSKDNMSATAIYFSNGFVPNPITYDISEKFGGMKSLDGRDLEANEFTFNLKNTLTGELIQTVTNKADGTVEFDPVKLSEAGEYRFRIEETFGNAAGITYDRSVYHVVLTVTQDDNGVLSVVEDSKKLYLATVSQQEVGGVPTEVTQYTDITENGEIAFENSYKAAPAQATIECTKLLEGRDIVDQDEFIFEVYITDSSFDVLSGPHMYVANGTRAAAPYGGGFIDVTEIENDKFEIVLTDIDEVGNYYFVITEQQGESGGIVYDTATYQVTVTVTDIGGQLEAKVTSIVKDNDEASEVVFNNGYVTTDAIVPLTALKTMNKPELLKADAYQFGIYAADLEEGAYVKTGEPIAVAKNDKDGKIAFRDGVFKNAGTYHFIVAEIIPEEKDANITYDTSEYLLKVEVTDDLLGGLHAVTTISKDGKAVDEIVFENIYTEPPAPEEPEIEEPEKVEPVQQPEIPKTGDNSNILLWAAMLFVSGGTVAALGFLGKKKKEDAE